jgi:two-component system invasion response regulator UvrY
MEKTTILIVDDHTLVRETWSYILNADPQFNVVGEACNGQEAVNQASQLRPQVVIMDINMPGINGIDATEIICRSLPGTKVLGISLHTQPAYARRMMQNGASGYVTKSSSREEMFKAITEIRNDRKYVCEEVKEILSKQVLENNGQDVLRTLSRRELEIITHIRKGSSSRTIAELLNISIKTVEVHRYNILKKLQLRNTAALVNFMSSHQFDL